VRSQGTGAFPRRSHVGGSVTGSYLRTAATVGGRRVLTFRVETTSIADPDLEPAVLAAEFCPRTS
jgi:D-alanyl-D-alanine carboxypeptidase